MVVSSMKMETTVVRNQKQTRTRTHGRAPWRTMVAYGHGPGRFTIACKHSTRRCKARAQHTDKQARHSLDGTLIAMVTMWPNGHNTEV